MAKLKWKKEKGKLIAYEYIHPTIEIDKKRNGRYELYYSGDIVFKREFRRLKSAKQVAQLIHNG